MLAAVASGDVADTDGGYAEDFGLDVYAEVVVKGAGLAVGGGGSVAGQGAVYHCGAAQGFVSMPVAGDAARAEDGRTEGELAAAASHEEGGIGEPVGKEPFERVGVPAEDQVDGILQNLEEVLADV